LAIAVLFYLIHGLSGALPGVNGQDCSPPFLACTPDNAMGQVGTVEDFVTDLTYRGNLKEVWAVEAPQPGFNTLSVSRFTVYREDLQSGRRAFNANVVQRVLGIS